MSASSSSRENGVRRLCVATTWRGAMCGNRAGFIYQVVQGREEPLCGIHARRVWGSQNLREIRGAT